jgi:hypothetical protein
MELGESVMGSGHIQERDKYSGCRKDVWAIGMTAIILSS